MACSLDGFIAGPNNDLSWLEEDYSSGMKLAADPDFIGFEDFMSQVGSMLMGRTTYDVVQKIGQWPYGETPVLVATRRPFEPAQATVRTVEGTIEELIERAKKAACDKDVYLDGGALIQQALRANLVDELTLTTVPVLLGSGTRLFDGLPSRRRLAFSGCSMSGEGLLQIRAEL